MQPMWLCLLLCKRFEVTLKNSQRRKVKQMQPVWLIITDYASSYASNLRVHLKTHSGEKSNKCNQCDYASSDASNLRVHLKTHIGEKSNKCNQCDFASSEEGNLRRHLKTHSGVKSNKCNWCFHLCVQLTDIKKHNNENATNLNMYPSEQAIWELAWKYTLLAKKWANTHVGAMHKGFNCMWYLMMWFFKQSFWLRE